MIRLSEIFAASEIIRDAAVQVTLGPGADRPGAVCYALEEAPLSKANANPNIAGIITTQEMAPRVASEKGCIVSTDPKRAFYALHNHLYAKGALSPHTQSGIHPEASVASSAVIGRNVVLERGVVICQGAIIEDFSIIGEDTYIGPNCVIGARGLQHTRIDGRNFPIEFAGAVRLGRRCEIFAGAIIPKPYLSEFTEIGDDVKLGSRGSIGHGCKVGNAAIIGTLSVVGGNSRIGADVWIGPNVAIADGLSVGRGAQVLIGSVVVKDVADGAVVSGNFAIDHGLHLKHFTRMRHGK